MFDVAISALKLLEAVILGEMHKARKKGSDKLLVELRKHLSGEGPLTFDQALAMVRNEIQRLNTLGNALRAKQEANKKLPASDEPDIS